jgi:16S rRNA (cytosine967-C5)-methyltransferase
MFCTVFIDSSWRNGRSVGQPSHTCSLSHHENHDVVAAFLKAHPEFTPVPAADTHGGTFDGLGTTLLPGTRNTDGFYVASLRRA